MKPSVYELDRIIQELTQFRQLLSREQLTDQRVEDLQQFWCDLYALDVESVWIRKSRTNVAQEVRAKTWLALRHKYSYTYADLASHTGYDHAHIYRECKKYATTNSD